MITEIAVADLKEYSSLVSERAAKDQPFWYRGVRDAHWHHLTPSLYRHQIAKTSDEFRDLEEELMAAFAQRALPFYPTIPSDPMEMLFFMQHHGVPTRLLDWSENPLVALFFSLENALWEDPTKATDAAVWIIDPNKLNKLAFHNHEGSDRILSPQDDLLNAYKPKGLRKNSGKLPIAMFGVHNSRRIVAQRGVFVLSGSNTEPMDKDPALIDADFMTKVIIKKEKKPALAKSLFNMGVTDSVIYPDLDGLGREIKNRAGFWRSA